MSIFFSSSARSVASPLQGPTEPSHSNELCENYMPRMVTIEERGRLHLRTEIQITPTSLGQEVGVIRFYRLFMDGTPCDSFSSGRLSPRLSSRLLSALSENATPSALAEIMIRDSERCGTEVWGEYQIEHPAAVHCSGTGLITWLHRPDHAELGAFIAGATGVELHYVQEDRRNGDNEPAGALTVRSTWLGDRTNGEIDLRNSYGALLWRGAVPVEPGGRHNRAAIGRALDETVAAFCSKGAEATAEQLEVRRLTSPLEQFRFCSGDCSASYRDCGATMSICIARLSTSKQVILEIPKTACSESKAQQWTRQLVHTLEPPQRWGETVDQDSAHVARMLSEAVRTVVITGQGPEQRWLRDPELLSGSARWVNNARSGFQVLVEALQGLEYSEIVLPNRAMHDVSRLGFALAADLHGYVEAANGLGARRRYYLTTPADPEERAAWLRHQAAFFSRAPRGCLVELGIECTPGHGTFYDLRSFRRLAAYEKVGSLCRALFARGLVPYENGRFPEGDIQPYGHDSFVVTCLRGSYNSVTALVGAEGACSVQISFGRVPLLWKLLGVPTELTFERFNPFTFSVDEILEAADAAAFAPNPERFKRTNACHAIIRNSHLKASGIW